MKDRYQCRIDIIKFFENMLNFTLKECTGRLAANSTTSVSFSTRNGSISTVFFKKMWFCHLLLKNCRNATISRRITLNVQ